MKRKLFRMDDEEKRRIREEIKRFLIKKEEITFAYLHGSFFEGTPFHDIDIGIFVHDIPMDMATKYGFDLSGIIENQLKIPIDIRVINYAPIPFLFYVVRSDLIVNRNDDMQSAFAKRVVMRYLDMKPLRDRAFREMFSEWE